MAVVRRKSVTRTSGLPQKQRHLAERSSLKRRDDPFRMSGRPSVDKRLRREIADQRTVVAGLQRRCLHHQYGYQLLLGIHPKRRAPYASPEVLSWTSSASGCALLGYGRQTRVQSLGLPSASARMQRRAIGGGGTIGIVIYSLIMARARARAENSHNEPCRALSRRATRAELSVDQLHELMVGVTRR